MKDIRQTREYGNYLSKIGWIVVRRNDTNYFIRKLPVIGSVLKIQRPENLSKKDIKILSNLCKKYRVFQIIIEPKNSTQVSLLTKHRFHKSKSPYLPSKTLHLDLSKSKSRLFNELKKDARYCLHKSQNSNVKFQNVRDVKKFRNAWKKSVPMKRYVPSLSDLKALKKSFGNNCLFLTCINEEKQIEAGAIFLSTGKIAYYWQAFTNEVGRKSFAQYKIVWEAILWAKKTGAKIFDFEGIYDKRFPNKSWLGFTHFKKSFGGYEVKYPGAFIKVSLLRCKPMFQV